MTDTKKVGMVDYVDNFLAENAALKRKLQSKSEALLILSKELDQCRTERDQFKLMAEQLQDRYTALKKKSHVLGFERLPFYSDGDEISGKSVIQILSETKEKNKALKIEVEDLRQRLRDAEGDMKVLRMTVNQQKNFASGGDSVEFPLHQREELVQQLEILNIKCEQLEMDFQSVLDEKEELVVERDAYKCKMHRLNYALNTCLKGDGAKLIDIDALVMECRYLQDRVCQMEEEKKLADQAIQKYKRMVDKKRSKGSLKLGTSDCTGVVMSHKQVQDLLEHGTSSQLPNTPATLSDLKSLCLALLEALNDKSLALSHQRKTNKILANRITDLEHRNQIRKENGNILTFPSQVLLDGYSSSEVDKDKCLELDLNSIHNETEESLSICNTTERSKMSSASPTLDHPSAKQYKKCHGSDNLIASNDCYMITNQDTNPSNKEENLPPHLQLLVEQCMEQVSREISTYPNTPC